MKKNKLRIYVMFHFISNITLFLSTVAFFIFMFSELLNDIVYINLVTLTVFLIVSLILVGIFGSLRKSIIVQNLIEFVEDLYNKVLDGYTIQQVENILGEGFETSNKTSDQGKIIIMEWQQTLTSLEIYKINITFKDGFMVEKSKSIVELPRRSQSWHDFHSTT